MKKLLCTVAVCCACMSGFAQSNTTVEQSIFNVQTGVLGVYINNEYRISPRWALRTETGLDAGFSVSSDESDWGLAPVINLEPRFYYNIAKRAGKGRNTTKNAANFLTVSARCNPGVLVTSSNEDMKMATHLFLIPKWGIRRNIGKSNFNYEAGIGIGYYTLLGNDKKYYQDKSGVAIDLNLRIGFCF